MIGSVCYSWPRRKFTNVFYEGIRHFRFSSIQCQLQPNSPPPMQLRDYQLAAIQSVQTAIDDGVNRSAVILATGGGKTVVFSHLIPLLTSSTPKRGNKTLVLAHREELVRQAASTISRINPDLKVDIDMRFQIPDHEHADVIVGSVPTLVRMSRLERYDPQQYKTIILDECHHAAANSWIKILKYFNADHPASEIYVLGFTATMERNDGKNLGMMFDKIVFERNLLEMVTNKELVDVKFLAMDLDIDLSQVKTKQEDYDVNNLSEVMNTSDNNLMLALSYIQLSKQYKFKSTLIFCVDINHCKTLCGVLQRQGINAQYVTGDTARVERQEIINDFKSGIIQVLCNVQVFTEGTDIPNIDSLFLARPTKSRSLLVQMIGRGLRHHKEKTLCYVIDMVGTRGTGIQSVPTLFALPANFPIHEKSYQELAEDKREHDEQELIKKEMERRQIELETHEKLTDLQKRKQEVVLKFSSFEGFLAIESHDLEKYKQNVTVNETFRNSSLTWVRLEYDVWGLSVGKEDFLLIKRLSNENEEVDFELTLNRFASKAQIVSSNFKCPRIIKLSLIEVNPNLDNILNRAAALFANQANNGKFRQMLKYGNHPLTEKQYTYLYDKLAHQIKYYYTDTFEMREDLQKKLKTISRSRGMGLMFAFKYGSKSLWVKWELQRLLGPNRKTNKVVKKLIDQHEKEKIKIQHISNDKMIEMAVDLS